jgi:hypothetical protein
MMRLVFWAGMLSCILVAIALYQTALHFQPPRLGDATASGVPEQPFAKSEQAGALDQARLAASLPISESFLLTERQADSVEDGEPIDVFLLSSAKKKTDMEAAQVQDSRLTRLMPRVVEDVVPPPVAKK